ncbi:hypothetical protein Pmob_1059 [Petrotoga mobilis SJ95]|jgi:hypothetical protein|uniref:Uncharacterized protein n=1 Tax=Petrotoga mobilis (strain DSM 10674 / SJ95) TaxID=403833 RepID=A9BG22_PETMO|nr:MULTISPECIES: hypothetical protein [Petrotoga]ABX31778.1 hypothetical protein Pmob_1059 [Petrotoga mobilis SJ95]MBL5980789.1 hypothetical protein [Petrotoga sp. 8T1HF07.NaAc.6.1]
MNIKLLDKIVSKGQFIRPILNYVVHYLESDRSDKNKNIINYINVLKLKWDVKYDEALEIIDEASAPYCACMIYPIFFTDM